MKDIISKLSDAKHLKFAIVIVEPFRFRIENMVVLNSDIKKYKLWHLINTQEIESKMRSISGFYFNMTNMKSYGAHNNEMLDLIHPGEKLIGRIVLKMLEDQHSKLLLPDIDTLYLKDKINSSELPINDVFSDKKKMPLAAFTIIATF